MERMITEAFWAYYDFPIANGEIVERGHVICIDTANGGIVVKGKAAAGLIPVGLAMESGVGDGTKRFQVRLWREIQATWLDNDAVAPVAITDRGKFCALKNDTTVSLDATGRSNAGMVLDVQANKGVLVFFDYKSAA